jgi:hypothetical protein
MTKISEYPIISNPTEDDILIGTDVNSSDVTKNFSIGSIVNLVENGGRPYKSYTALLTQSGTSAPVASVLENTIGTVSYSYVGVGEYNINSSELFTVDKTLIFLGPGRYTTGVTILGTTIGGTSSITIYSRNTSNIGVNGLISSVPVEIRVYN